jgi:predicted O-methyltransferase YrrM
MTTLRTTIVRSPPALAARRAGGRVIAPAVRGRIAAGDHDQRVRWVRRLVPGSLGQIPEEIAGFGAFARDRQPVRICEIGTLMGGTSLFLCGLAPSVRTFVGIDIEPNNVQLVSALAPKPVDVTFITGSSRDPGVRGGLVTALAGELLDVLFVDGDHEYDGVRADLVEYRDLVRPGGLIAFHDIVADKGGRTSGDVPVLWQELRDRFVSHEFVADRDQNGYGIGVIEHDPAVAV